MAVAHSENMATFEALKQGTVSSASIMVPCPWLTEAAEYAQAYPDADLGVHLTLTSEWKTYRWGPVAPRDQVPSLLDPQGYFYRAASDVVQHARQEDVERELRAQVEAVLNMGIRPTHLDSHMGVLFTTPAMVAALVNVAREYHLPFLMGRFPNVPPETYAALEPRDVFIDRVYVLSPPVETNNWPSLYVDIVRTLPPGVSEFILHVAYDDAEMQAVTVGHTDFGSAWRERDLGIATSPEFRRALKENHVRLLTWRELGTLLPQ
jgi:predicted glycoside hydrolase/deacetylase ChbG (UPF0249 family)